MNVFASPYIFWLASWYPTRLDPFPGDFIQRHAKALALYHPLHVLHIAKDVDGKLTKSILVEETQNGNLKETIIYYHPKKIGISSIDKLISTQNFLRIGKGFIKKTVLENPNIFIHLHVAMRHGILALWAKNKFGISFGITEHWAGYDRKTYPEWLRPGKIFWHYTKKIFKNASFYYPEVNSMGVLINETIAKIPYKAIPNSVDTSLFKMDEGLKKEDEKFHFVHVSTLSYQKNIAGILDVLETFCPKYPNAFFTFVGPVTNEIKNRVEATKTLQKSILFTGSLPYQKVAEELKTAHAMVMFSRYENQPCVILEALCCGLPVISTNVGGIAEVINSQNGILIKTEDKLGLFNALKQMISEYKNMQPNQISTNATNRYSYQITGLQFIENYKQDLPNLFSIK